MAATVRWVSLAALILAILLLLTAVDAPAPPLFAGLFGALVLSLATRVRLILPSRLFRAGQAIVGISVAVQVDLDALSSVGADLIHISWIVLATLAVSVGCGQLLCLHGVTRVTATFSSIAGGASGMIALADDFGADSRIVLVNQYLRVLVILVTLPLVVTVVFASNATTHTTAPAPVAGHAMSYTFAALAVVTGLVGGRLLRLPASSLLGPLVAGIVLAAVPMFEDVAIPYWLQSVGFLLLGAQVGLRFTRKTVAAVAYMLPTVVLVLALSIAACAGLGVVLARLTGRSQLDAYLATTPGGLPAVLATSTATAGDVTFVTAAQTIRLLLVLLLAPVAARIVFRRR